MKEYKGYHYEINYDDCDESPDEWGDHEVFLVYDHRDFYIERRGFYPPEIHDYLKGDIDYDFSGYYIFPVYAYIHSGISLSLLYNGDRWDTSMRGYVLVKKSLRDYISEDIAKTYAEGCIENWNAYLSGQIYRYEIYKKEICEHCNHEEIEEIDSCGGYYDEEECETECKELIDNLIKDGK